MSKVVVFLPERKLGAGHSAYVNHNLQSSWARLLSSEPWLLERTKFTRRLGSRHGYLISLGE